jgi:peroxiredoxin
LAELRSLLKPNEEALLYAVSIDPPEKSREFKEKIASDGKGAVAFPVLSDPGHRVIEAYGLRDRRYDGKSAGDLSFEGIPKPAVYVLDREGRVAWAVVEEDYKVRPTNSDIRAALEALGAKAGRAGHGRGGGEAGGLAPALSVAGAPYIKENR